jgi:PRTRC genetic system protein A
MSITDKEKGKLAIHKMLVGHCVEEVPGDLKKKVIYVWQGNGIWEIRNLRLGTFTTHIHEFKTPGLDCNLKEGWALNVPKIPATLLDMTLSFFRKIYDKHSSEVFLQYFYDEKSKEYLLHCPKQKVSGASVSYERDEKFETREKILVFEIHSHGSMGAFFSGTDDKDEKDDRFFGVIGKVKKFYPEMKLRVSVGGRRREISVEDIFDIDEGNYHEESFPQEWVKKIQKQKVRKFKPKRRNPVCIYNGPGSRYRGRTYYPGIENDDYPGDGGFPPHSSFSRSGGCVQENLFPEQELRPLPYGSRETVETAEVEDRAALLERLGLDKQENMQKLEGYFASMGIEDPDDVDNYLDQIFDFYQTRPPGVDDDDDYMEQLSEHLGLSAEDVEDVDDKNATNVKYMQIGDKYFRVTEIHGKTIYEELEEDTSEENGNNGTNNQGDKEQVQEEDSRAEIIKDWRGIEW